MKPNKKTCDPSEDIWVDFKPSKRVYERSLTNNIDQRIARSERNYKRLEYALWIAGISVTVLAISLLISLTK